MGLWWGWSVIFVVILRSSHASSFDWSEQIGSQRRPPEPRSTPRSEGSHCLTGAENCWSRPLWAHISWRALRTNTVWSHRNNCQLNWIKVNFSYNFINEIMHYLGEYEVLIDKVKKIDWSNFQAKLPLVTFKLNKINCDDLITGKLHRQT